MHKFLAQRSPQQFLAGAVLIVLALVTEVLATHRLSAKLPVGLWWVGWTVVPGLVILVAIPLLLSPWRNKRIWHWLADLCLMAAVTIVLIFMLEGLFYVGNKIYARTQDNNPNYWSANRWRKLNLRDGSRAVTHLPDDILGYKNAPNLQVETERLGHSNRVLFKARYTTDAYGHRITPLKEGGSRDKFMLFFADSLIFGDGVNDDETLPAQTGDLALSYRPYNFGVSGYGPHQMMLQFQHGMVEPPVTEKSGLCLYLYINDHVRRVVGTIQIYQRAANGPFYRLDNNTDLVTYQRSDLQRTWGGRLRLLLGASNILQTLGFDSPNSGMRELLITSWTIQASRDEFKRRFNSDEFYVIISPGAYNKDIIPYLQHAGIRYLDYSGLLDPDNPQYHLFQDRHFSRLGYQKMAEQLAADLRLAQK